MNELARYITDGEYCEQCEINREAIQADDRRE